MNHKQKKFFLFLLIILSCITAGFVLLRQPPVVTLANRVLASCSTTAYRSTCYEREIPKLMNHITMEEAFAVTKIVQDKDPEFLYCHVLAHEISFRESAKNPSNWKDVVDRCPVAMCNYGCLHGSLVQHFRGTDVLTEAQLEEVLPDLRTVCEPRKGFSPSEIDRSMCYHALGHLAMYISGGKPDRSLTICQNVVPNPDTREFMETCAGGVFMTIFQGIDPEDIALVKDIKPQKIQVPEFCSRYGAYTRQCRQESFALFRDEIATPAGYMTFCSFAQTPKEIEDCTFIVVNDVTVRVLSEPDGIDSLTSYCLGVVQDRQELCFAGIAMRMVQIEPLRYVREAQDFCKIAKQHGVGDRCFEGVIFYAAFSFPKGSANWRRYCNGLQNPWKTQCFTKEGI